jgi:hypothetical protein
MSGTRALALCVAAWLATGCGSLARDITEPIDAGEARREVQRLLDSPAVGNAAEQIARRFVSGLVAGLDETALQENLRALSRTAADAIARDLGPALRQALASDALRADLAAMADEITRAAVRGLAEGVERDLGPALRAALERDVGPALRTALEREVGPGLAGMIDPPLRQRVGLLARDVTREGLAGADDAVGTRGGALLHRAEALLDRGALLFLVLTILAAVAALSLLALLPWQWTRMRRARAELARREQALLLLAHAIKTTEDRPWAPELRETLRHELSDSEAADYVREVLRRHPDLRMH